MALLALWAGSANAQFQIKSPDGNASIKFGLLLQGWADWTQDAASGGYAQNLFLRRARFILGGQIAPNVTFFMETDNPNLGKTPKSLGTGLIVQDAFMEWKPADQFALDAGLILIPMCRNCLQAATTLVSMDYGSFSFLNSAPTQSSVGRDTGFQAKGYLANKRLEYRFGVFQGIRQAGSRNGFRTAGRLQYSFLDVEVGPFYTGTYLGKKKIFEIGVGMDEQQDYRATSGDFFFDHPLANGDSVTLQYDYIRYDGGKTFATLPKQNDSFAEFGYYIHSVKVMPFLRYETQSFSDAVNESKDQTRYQAGFGYYPNGYNFNIKAGYTRIAPKVGTKTNQFTIQFQLFYF
jgi:hypothetical protein